MDKFLGAIRNASFALILVAATVVLVALSPDDYASLLQAYNEADSLRTIDNTSFLTAYREDELQELESNEEPRFKSALREVLSRLIGWNTSLMKVRVPLEAPSFPVHGATVGQMDDVFEGKYLDQWGLSVPNWGFGIYGIRDEAGQAKTELSYRSCKGCANITKSATIAAFVVDPSARCEKANVINSTGGNFPPDIQASVDLYFPLGDAVCHFGQLTSSPKATVRIFGFQNSKQWLITFPTSLNFYGAETPLTPSNF